MITADHGLLADLVHRALGLLVVARGGAQPLVDTIEAFIATAGNTSACARALHLSVWAVAYRITRIHELTGPLAGRSDHRFILELAVRARWLWAPASCYPGRCRRGDWRRGPGTARCTTPVRGRSPRSPGEGSRLQGSRGQP